MSATKGIYWAGFVNGRLQVDTIDDGWGGKNMRRTPALFTSRREARRQFHDVRRVEIKPATPKERP
jgi:hypothetical protein